MVSPSCLLGLRMTNLRRHLCRTICHELREGTLHGTWVPPACEKVTWDQALFFFFLLLWLDREKITDYRDKGRGHDRRLARKEIGDVCTQAREKTPMFSQLYFLNFYLQLCTRHHKRAFLKASKNMNSCRWFLQRFNQNISRVFVSTFLPYNSHSFWCSVQHSL